MIRRVIGTFFSRLSNVAVTLGISILVSNSLGAAGRGEQAAFLLSVTLICIATQVVGGTAITMITPKYPGRQILNLSYVWAAASGIVAWVVLYLIGALGQYAIHILVISVVHSIWSNNAFYLLGKEKGGWFNSLNFIYSLVTLLYLAVVWWLGEMQLKHYVIGLYLGHACSLGASFVGLKGKLEGERTAYTELLRKFIKHGGYIQLANVAQLLKNRIHFYIIVYYLGDSALGIYSNAVAIADGIWIISRSTAIVQFSKVVNMDSDEEARKMTVGYTWLSSGLTLCAVLVAIAIPDSLFTMIFGREFTGIHEVLMYLSVAVVALSSSNLISHYFSGIGLNHINVIGSVIGLIITSALGYWLIPTMGLSGAAIASSVAFTATAVFHWITFLVKGKSRYL
ncbi:MAG: polysaccharide biosynthesis C-terminal domain-containing protein [Bacteroidota bacterium]